MLFATGESDVVSELDELPDVGSHSKTCSSELAVPLQLYVLVGEIKRVSNQLDLRDGWMVAERHAANRRLSARRAFRIFFAVSHGVSSSFLRRTLFRSVRNACASIRFCFRSDTFRSVSLLLPLPGFCC